MLHIDHAETDVAHHALSATQHVVALPGNPAALYPSRLGGTASQAEQKRSALASAMVVMADPQSAQQTLPTLGEVTLPKPVGDPATAAALDSLVEITDEVLHKLYATATAHCRSYQHFQQDVAATDAKFASELRGCLRG
ncbi:hypothetical protein ACFPVT_01945 [Corynebacterium choanae]|uniref:Uncharacterized protein n=1 Tax=Corynebacterium choanae TaxID=1862358 RepID=A0A3G6J3W7_9CORY|nr:hypothetical protein [Corynebacterium choanae]AZA12636.1 hypothetical protein CCHOA_01040 [Corynebacterium choanae]